MTIPIVEITGIRKRFGETAVLHGIDLAIQPGQIVGLIGENGAGKSTLMNIIAGALRTSAGTIAFNGVPVELESIRQGGALGVRFVHQELSTAGALSVAENIFLGGYLAGASGLISRKRLNAEARRILARVGLGHINPSLPLGSLRSGEQQLVELAKALAEEPRLLILDEPTSSLTPSEAARLFALAHELAARGVGLIFITHRLEEALAHCDRVVVLRDGRLVVDLDARSTSKPELIMHMVGRPTVFAYRPRAATAASPRLEISNLSDGAQLVGVDLSARAGEIVGMFGLVGAGRTEFLETLYGHRRARSGAVTVDGAPLRLGDVNAMVRGGLFMLPEGRKTRGILPTHSVRRNISIAGLAQFTRAGFVDRRREARDSDRLAQTLAIRMAHSGQIISSLSGGNQQKALFARALLASPKVLLLDEPTHGVDVGAKAEIYDIIRRLASDGATVLVASSELPEILAIADRCIVFAGGRIVADLDRSTMSEEAILAAAFTPPPAAELEGRALHG
jgi:ribose transport system ATP-binding protein